MEARSLLPALPGCMGNLNVDALPEAKANGDGDPAAMGVMAGFTVIMNLDAAPG